METIRINQAKLEDYALKFAQKACDSFYSMYKTNVVGAEIMKITPVDQVNYFILFNLFENWKEEVSKIQSPYFDYTDAEVKEALKSFMNTVSMHISIKREDLEPLLKNAVINTVNLAAMPKLFISNFLHNLKEKTSIEQLITYEKYFKIHKELLSEVIQKSKTLDRNEITQTYLVNIYTEIASTFIADPKMQESTFYSLNTVLQCNFEELLTPNQIEIKTLEPVQATIPDPKPVIEVVPNIDISEFKKDNFKANESSKISNRILDQKSTMTINQRFMFVEQLFKGEKWEFDNALNKLEHCDSYDSAIKMMLSDYAIKYDWDTENEQVAELFDFIGKKFT